MEHPQCHFISGFFFVEFILVGRSTSVPGKYCKLHHFLDLIFSFLIESFINLEKYTQMELKIKQGDRNTFCLEFLSSNYR